MLLVVEGLQLAAGVSERDRAIACSTSGCSPSNGSGASCREMPQTEPGAWLLLSASDDDRLTAQLGEALKSDGAQCTNRALAARTVDQSECRAPRSSSLRGLTGVVVVTAPPAAGADDDCGGVGNTCRTWSASPANCAELPGEPPRLFVVTRNAASVRRGRSAEPRTRRAARADAGDRLRTPASERHPDRCGRRHRPPSRWRGNCSAGPRRTRPRGGTAIGTPPGCGPSPLRPAERRTTVVDHERDGMRLRSPHSR